MKTLQEVVKPLVNEHGDMHWNVGVVLAITPPHSLTVQFPGAAAGAGTTGCGYLDSYVPQVGHIVHAITSETRGVLVLGSTGMATTDDPPPGPPEPPEAPDAVSDPARCGTFRTIMDGRVSFVAGRVIQGPGYMGVWGFDGLASAISVARNAGLIVSVDAEITLLHGGPEIALSLVSNSDGNPAISWPVRRDGPLELGIPTRVALPLGWLDELESGVAVIGVSNTSSVPLAAFDTSMGIYLTVQTV